MLKWEAFGCGAETKLFYGSDACAVLRQFPDNVVHTVCTSPPYWGLRDYDEDGQIGLETMPEAYIARIVEVFREVRRVLRDDGTLWINLGDSYNAHPGRKTSDKAGPKQVTVRGAQAAPSRSVVDLKPKDLIGIPWRVALALQADGWYLRQDIVWSKPNPMPESVRDRCTKSHEYVFLLSKSERYYFDNDAIKEPAAVGTRNRRSVWTTATVPYKGAHFATWPPELVRPMILAGTSERGVCSACLAPWTRQITNKDTLSTGASVGGYPSRHDRGVRTKDRSGNGGNVLATKRVGSNIWAASCKCGAPTTSATVLDPFSGSGTTGKVAIEEGRNYVGIDLNLSYLPLAESRIQNVQMKLR
jgi:DNA modification methylase